MTNSSDIPTEFPPTPGDTLVFENDRVRVWSMTLEPHGMFDWHQHFHDHVILWPSGARVEIQNLGDGDVWQQQESTPGFTMFKTVGSGGPLVPHRIRSMEDFEVTHYIVELISEESPSPVELPIQSNDRGRSVDDV